MFTIFLRRLQRYTLLIKLLLFFPSVAGLAYLIVNTSPDLLNLLGAVFLLSVSLFILLSFFVSARISFLVTLAITFLTFLKAVDLITPLNLVLFIVFLILLAFYFRQTPVKKETGEEKASFHTRPVFPKGWPFKVGKRHKEV